MQLRWLCTPVMLIALAAPVLSAQSSETLQVTIPFLFTVHNVYMPAGQYTISRASDLSGLLAIRNADTRQTVFFLGSARGGGATSNQSSVAFRSGSGHYALTDIWWAGQPTGVQLPAPRELPATASSRPPEVMMILYK